MPSAVLLAVVGAGAIGCGAAAARDGEEGDSAASAAAPASVAPDTALSFAAQRLATGVRLSYAVRGDPAGPAVILLHGYGDSWFSFSPILPLLPATYRVYALDQRGHGGSDQPASGYHMADMAADVVAFMDARRIPSAVVVGHSLGTFVAQYVARAAPDRIRGLVLIAGAPSMRYLAGVGELAAVVASLQDSVPREFIREFQASTVHKPVPAPFMARVIEESGKLQPHAWRGIMEASLASAPVRAGSGVTIPTLLLRGDRDAVFPREAQDSLLAMIPGASLRVYPETGHAVHWERPQETADDITAFLARLAAGT
jgi:pimeloyl-ACP methyl ester carboxylesterase